MEIIYSFEVYDTDYDVLQSHLRATGQTNHYSHYNIAVRVMDSKLMCTYINQN